MNKTRDYKFTDEQMVRLLDMVRQIVVIDRCEIPEDFIETEWQHLKVKNPNLHNDLDPYGVLVSQTLDIPNIW